MIEQAVHGTEGAATMRAIIGIAREFGIDVVAQGVETVEQWSFLTATSPQTKVQGYYFSRPVPADDAAAMLKRGNVAPAPERTAAQ